MTHPTLQAIENVADKRYQSAFCPHNDDAAGCKAAITYLEHIKTKWTNSQRVQTFCNALIEGYQA